MFFYTWVVYYRVRAGVPKWSTGQRLGRCGIVLRRFESCLLHTMVDKNTDKDELEEKVQKHMEDREDAYVKMGSVDSPPDSCTVPTDDWTDWVNCPNCGYTSITSENLTDQLEIECPECPAVSPSLETFPGVKKRFPTAEDVAESTGRDAEEVQNSWRQLF